MSKPHILYVDDDEANLIGFKYQFQDRYMIHVAPSAKEGHRILGEHPIELILADQRMPRVTGVEFLERIRREYPGAVRCLVTGYSDINAVIDAVNKGHVYHYFTKPWNESELRETLDEALRDSRAARKRALLLDELVGANDRLRNYEHIVSGSADMMALIDRSFAFLSANSAYALTFGLTPSAMVGRTLCEVFGRDFFAARLAPHVSRCLEGQDTHHQVWCDFPTQGLRYMDCEYRPYRDEAGAIVGFVMTGRDITAQARAEARHEALAHQKRLSQRMEAIGRMAGGIAHDVNNLLSAILLTAEFLRVDASDPEALDKSIRDILRACEQGTALTRQLLTFSGQQLLQPERVSINTVVLDMQSMLRQTLGHDHELVMELEPDLGHTLSDVAQLNQSILNLVINARDAMPGGGRLTCETENLDLEQASLLSTAKLEPGPYVVLRISDTGTGIAPEDLEKIFDPFFTTKDRSQGLGLGLGTVHGLVQQSGGAIDVHTMVGRGTTMSLFLPRLEAQAQSPRPRDQDLKAEGLRGTETILLVEDDARLRQLLCSTLEGQGYRILSAAGPGEAMLLSERFRERISLLLANVVMPRSYGAELAAYLLEKRPEMKVLFISGFTKGDHTTFERAGFLPRPHSAVALCKKVRRILDTP